jgi:hypothetical protein
MIKLFNILFNILRVFLARVFFALEVRMKIFPKFGAKKPLNNGFLTKYWIKWALRGTFWPVSEKPQILNCLLYLSSMPGS